MSEPPDPAKVLTAARTRAAALREVADKIKLAIDEAKVTHQLAVAQAAVREAADLPAVPPLDVGVSAVDAALDVYAKTGLIPPSLTQPGGPGKLPPSIWGPAAIAGVAAALKVDPALVEKFVADWFDIEDRYPTPQLVIKSYPNLPGAAVTVTPVVKVTPAVTVTPPAVTPPVPTEKCLPTGSPPTGGYYGNADSFAYAKAFNRVTVVGGLTREANALINGTLAFNDADAHSLLLSELLVTWTGNYDPTGKLKIYKVTALPAPPTCQYHTDPLLGQVWVSA